MDYEKNKNEKIREASELFKMIGIETIYEKYYGFDYSPGFSEYKRESDQVKDPEFHWTRLSINSNIGCIIE